MARAQLNRHLKPVMAECMSASSLLSDGEDICIDGVTAEGRRVCISITEKQAETLAETLVRAVDRGFWGDKPVSGILIPHRSDTLL